MSAHRLVPVSQPLTFDLLDRGRTEWRCRDCPARGDFDVLRRSNACANLAGQISGAGAAQTARPRGRNLTGGPAIRGR